MCCQSTQLVQKRSIDISCAEVGLFFFSSILWPSCAVSVRRWNQITCSLASSVLLVAVVAVEGGDVCCFFLFGGFGRSDCLPFKAAGS